MAKYTTESVIKSGIKKHGAFYDYSLTKYKNSKSKITIICPFHGKFKVLPTKHIKGRGCRRCKVSKGEFLIHKWLTENKIQYTSEKTYDDCRNPLTNRKLRFDFFVPNLNLIVEFDGYQHTDPNGGRYKVSKKKFEGIQFRDKIKNEYCITNNIKLIRISYKEVCNVNNILSENIISNSNS